VYSVIVYTPLLPYNNTIHHNSYIHHTNTIYLILYTQPTIYQNNPLYTGLGTKQALFASQSVGGGAEVRIMYNISICLYNSMYYIIYYIIYYSSITGYYKLTTIHYIHYTN
jgi:hypothetical protein